MCFCHEKPAWSDHGVDAEHDFDELRQPGRRRAAVDDLRRGPATAQGAAGRIRHGRRGARRRAGRPAAVQGIGAELTRRIAVARDEIDVQAEMDRCAAARASRS